MPWFRQTLFSIDLLPFVRSLKHVFFSINHFPTCIGSKLKILYKSCERKLNYKFLHTSDRNFCTNNFLTLLLCCCIKGAVILDRTNRNVLNLRLLIQYHHLAPLFEGGSSAICIEIRLSWCWTFNNKDIRHLTQHKVSGILSLGTNIK